MFKKSRGKGKGLSKAQQRQLERLQKLQALSQSANVSGLNSLDAARFNNAEELTPLFTLTMDQAAINSETTPAYLIPSRETQVVETAPGTNYGIEQKTGTQVVSYEPIPVYPTQEVTPTNTINTNYLPTTNKTMNPLVTVQPSFRAPSAAAVFDLNITRSSANIAANLPVPIFGVLDRESNYKEIISDMLPAGTTYTISLSSSGKGLTFDYTQGMVHDTITIECPQVPYVNLLRASQGSVLEMSQNKLIISDTTLQAQFSQGISIINNSLFGKEEKDTFTPNQYKSDLQNQNDIRILTNTINITSEKSLVFSVIDEAFTITLTSFISNYDFVR